jgi:hypothetical protein
MSNSDMYILYTPTAPILFLQFLNEHVVKHLTALLNGFFRKKGSVPGNIVSGLTDHAVYRIDVEEFQRTISQLADCWVIVAENQLKVRMHEGGHWYLMHSITVELN